jgi:hypothetical protein
MVDVSMRKNHAINVLGIKIREATVHLVCVFSAPLIKTAVEKNPLPIHLQ